MFGENKIEAMSYKVTIEWRLTLPNNKTDKVRLKVILRLRTNGLSRLALNAVYD